MADDRVHRMEAQLAALTARIWRMEEALRKQGIVVETEAEKSSPPPAAEPGGASAAAGQAPFVAAPAYKPLFAQIGVPSRDGDADSLESRIGSRWFNRLGVLAILFALAWFLKLAFDNHWIGPVGRVSAGLAAGIGAVVWSERFRRRGYKAFAYSLKAVGGGALYLSLWAAFQLYHLMAGGLAFAAMILITALNAFWAWFENAELLACYALIGALATPALLSTGENHEISLFLYLLLIVLALLALTAARPWARLLLGAYLGATVYFWAWFFRFYNSSEFALTFLFAALFFLVFAAAPRLALGHAGGELERAFWDSLTQVALPAANAVFGYLALYCIFWEAHQRDAGGWIALLLSGFYLLLLDLPERGVWRKSTVLLDSLHLILSAAFLTLAILLKLDGRSITLGWLAEGAALFWIANRRRNGLLRLLSLLVVALGLGRALIYNRLAAYVPIFNARFGCYLEAIAVLALIAWFSVRADEAEQPAFPFPQKALAAAAVLVINLLILTSVGWEIDSFWWLRCWKGEVNRLDIFEMYAQFSYSVFFMLFGVALLLLGFWRKSSFLRWQALALIALTIGKVFLVDISALSQGYRVLSFLGLGALLLAVSFIYQKDLLRLRAGGRGGG